MKALSRPGLVSFLLCCTVLVLIGWERLLHPGLWAEDGKIFVPDALTLGWSSVLLPYEGYFHLLTRIFVRVFCYLPLYWLPWLINTFCFVLYAWMASLFSRSEYRGVVASDLDRILISLGICLIPGMYEILGNFCNTHRLLALAMFVMVIKPARIDLSKRDLFGTFVIAGSAGEVVAFVPAFLYRIFHRSREGLSISKELGVLGIVCLWTVANIAVRKTNSAPMHPEFFEIARATLAAWIFNFTIQPLTGWRLGENLYTFARPLFYAVSCGFTLLISRIVYLHYRRRDLLIPLAILGLCGIQILAWLVRPTDLNLYGTFFPPMWFGRLRNVHTLLFAGFFFWAVSSSRGFRFAGTFYVLLYFALLTPVKVPLHGDTSAWPMQAAKLESAVKTGCPREVVFPVFPEGWGELTYHATIPAGDCK